MAIAVGDRLGPYEILGQIGAGGMGEVWKARDTRLNRTVAIKISAAQFSERFEREARTIAALNHPHICTLYDVGPNYLVMEYIEGVPVRGPLPLDQALKLAGQIADALDAAHRKGVIHRDLKPANILLTKAGAKLLDFGELQATIADSRTALTTQNVFVGSRLGALGASLVGLLGLMMTSVGIYGTVGFAVVQRTQEIGIRLALGATRRDVLGMVLIQTMRPVAAGLAAGFVGAALASRLMHSVLFGLSTLDPVAFLGVAALLAAVSLAAGYLPARRATRVDPMIALRYE